MMDNLPLLLMISAFSLGLRHGIDWDHIAAISDIVGSVTRDTKSSKIESLAMAACYAIGHGLIVLILGIAAIQFHSLLPRSIDGVMGRLVGISLLVLGAWLSYSVVISITSNTEWKPVSRWMLILSVLTRLKQNIASNWFGKKLADSSSASVNGYLAASIIGILHGIGAETGTQVLLIVAAAGAGHFAGLEMLFAFVAGLVVSNTTVAIAGIWGFSSALSKKPVFVTAGILTAILSLSVGTMFLLGKEERLPDLQHLLSKTKPTNMANV